MAKSDTTTLTRDHSQSDMVTPITTTEQSSTGLPQVNNSQSLSRPLDATPPSIIGLADEIDTLAPEEPLDLQVVVHVLERAARLWPGHVYVLDTHILDVLRAYGEDSDMFDENRRQIASIPVDGVILVPICVGQHHSLFILKKCIFQGASVCQAFIYDSILLRRINDEGNFDPQYWEFLAETLSFVQRSLFSFCPPMEKLYIDLMMCPQQPNDYDCGVAVCLNAMDYIAHRGMLTLPMAARAYCEAPRLDIIAGSVAFSPERRLESPADKLGNLYWSAGRRFVFQLCDRAIDHAPPANREALIDARENVADQLEELITSEQAAMEADASDLSDSTSSPSAPVSSEDGEHAAWTRHCWINSKIALLYLMKRLQDVASNMGTPAFQEEDVRVFTNARTVSVHPIHEAQRQRITEIAQDNAWRDPELVQEFFDDVVTAKSALQEVRFPEGWETPEQFGVTSEVTT